MTTYYLSSSTNIPYALSFSVIPPPSLVGATQQYPFKITLSAADTNEHVIDLYAQYSKSSPYTTPNKWSHILPQHKFLDTNGNVITQITTTDTEILSGSVVIGVTGTAEYYFVDNIGSNLGEPVILWNTLSVSGLPIYSESNNGENPIPSYANSKIIAGLPYYINGCVPDALQITRNGIDSMSDSTYWINQNIPSFFTISYDQYPEFGCSIDETKTLFDYPSSNALGLAMGIISSGITTIPTSSQIWETLDDLAGPYFQKFDTKGYNRSGYSRNMVKANTITLNTTITAAANVNYATYKHTPFIWISNPENNLLHKISYPHLNQTTINNITSWLDGFNTIGYGYQFNTEYITTRPEPMSLSGFGGIYGVAVDPCFNVWCADAELDKLYKFNSLGEQITSINLVSGCTPAGISLDSTNNFWVSLFDSVSVLKYSGSTGELLTAINPLGNQTSPIDGFGVDPDYKPTISQTDKDNNLWISFTNSLCSYLDKYDTNGNFITSVSLPLCSNPMDIIVDKENNVWLTLTYHSTPSGGNVNKYDTTGTLLSTITAYHPEYITLDNNNNLYFTSDYNKVTKVNLNSGTKTTSAYGISASPTWYGNQLNYNALEGIAADSTNRIWIINSIESLVYVISGDIMLNTYSFPTNRTQYCIDGNFTQLESTEPYEKSIQAFGDWTGLQWYQKYASSTQYYLTGVSDPFNIDDFSGYDIRRYNESWDATNQIRDYALNDTLYSNYNLFEGYIGSMIGGLETSANSIGRKVYERIANFVPNNVDVDVCGINPLYSLAKSIDVPIDDYNFHMPSDLQRIMDILSIDHKRLWGDRCKCSSNYRGSWGYCSNCGHKHDSNRGTAIDSETQILSADIPILAEYKYDRDYYEKIIPRTTLVYDISTTYVEETSTFYVPTLSTYEVPVLSTIYLSGETIVYVSSAVIGEIEITHTIPWDITYIQKYELNDYFPRITGLPFPGCNADPSTYRDLYGPKFFANPLPVSSVLICYDQLQPDDHFGIDGVILYPGCSANTYLHTFPAGYVLKSVIPPSGGSLPLSSCGVTIQIWDNLGVATGLMSSTARIAFSGVESSYLSTTTVISGFYIMVPSSIEVITPSSFYVDVLTSNYIDVLSSFNYFTTISTTISLPPITAYSLYNYVSTYLLNDPTYYCYYEYIPTPCNIQIEGVINWSDEYTTLDETLSGLDEWYGNGELVEKQLNYIIHKGLGF